MEVLKQKLKFVQDYLNNKGIPIPLISDSGKPSVSLTVMLTSFLVWILGITEVIKDMDVDKAENMVMITASLYFGRKLTKDNKGNKLDVSTQKQGESESV